MALVRVLLNFMVAGALLGVLLVSWLGPGFIEWDNKLGSGGVGQCICSDQALLGARYLLAYQMRGCAIGAVSGVIIGAVFLRMRRKSVAATPPAA
jgi:hypothetical protein